MDHADLKTTTEHYIDPRIARQVSAADVLPDPMPPDDERPTFKVVG